MSRHAERDPQREIAAVREAIRALAGNASAWRVFVTYLARLDREAADRLVGTDDTDDMLRQQGAARALRNLYVLAATAPDSAPHTAAAAPHGPLL